MTIVKTLKRIFIISLILVCFIFSVFYIGGVLCSWKSPGLYEGTLNKENNSSGFAEERAKGEAMEAYGYTKLVTIDEIPPISGIKAIVILNYRDIRPHRSITTPSLNAAEKFQVIGNPEEVGKIIGRDIPSNWVIGDSSDITKITDDFRNATRCTFPPSRGLRHLLEALLLYKPSDAWSDYLFAKRHGIPIKDYYWVFPPPECYGGIHDWWPNWGWAIFVTESKGYALKYAIESRPNRIYGPDYYSRKLYKDLTSLYDKAKK